MHPPYQGVHQPTMDLIFLRCCFCPPETRGKMRGKGQIQCLREASCWRQGDGHAPPKDPPGGPAPVGRVQSTAVPPPPPRASVSSSSVVAVRVAWSPPRGAHSTRVAPPTGSPVTPAGSQAPVGPQRGCSILCGTPLHHSPSSIFPNLPKGCRGHRAVTAPPVWPLQRCGCTVGPILSHVPPSHTAKHPHIDLGRVCDPPAPEPPQKRSEGVRGVEIQPLQTPSLVHRD